jgi:hypothetical protein
MTDQKRDLRAGKPGETGNTDATLAGHEARIMPIENSGEHSVEPLAGSKGGVAEGQVTKSN